MNKKFLSALLLGALTVTSTGTLVSCKDYDDDITNLQEQIDKNAKAIKEINDLIAKGGVITGTTSVEGGVKVTLSNGNEFTIKNGEKGAKGDPGVSWTIGEDGFWYKDGVVTTYKAIGKDGEKGEKGDPGAPGAPGAPGKDGKDATASGENGKYYVPNANTGKFDIYKDGKLVESTNISFLGSGVITAVKDDAKKTLTLYGVTGGSGENKAVVISMSGTLSSLSYRPALYLDGIETIEYPWLFGNTMKSVAATADKNFQDKVVKGLSVQDYVADTKTFVYGPAWAVEYDASPWNAAVTEEDLAGYNVLNPTAIYNTRAAVAALGAVTSPAYAFPGKDGGKKLFSMNNGTGVLTTGLQIKNPDKFTNETPTTDSRNDVNTVALRVKNSEGTEVVADYALVQPEKTVIDGMVWSQEAKCIDENANEKVRTGDEPCNLLPGEKIKHVWDAPEKALQDERGAALSLYFEDEVGVDLSKYVAVRLVKSKNLKKNQEPEFITVSPEEALQWGLTFHYNIVNYKLDTNETSESMFLKKIDAKDTDGKFRAQNVKENLAIGQAANASVGRMPLVQVTVTNDKGAVVLDGYILLYITKYAETNGKNDKWTEQETTFDPCNANDVFTTTWDQFNDLMLTQYLDMTKETFDHQYAPDLFTDGSTMVQYADYKDKGEQDYNRNALGTVLYKGNAEGNTNHTWQWTIPAKEIEAKLHHKDSYTFTTWVRFKALDKKSAKYPYIYVKLTAKVNNKKTTTYTFGEKNEKMYWFDNGKVVQFDAVNPYIGGYLSTINRSVRSTLLKNIESFNAPMHHYYFVPGEITVTDEYTGKTYTLTPQSSASDVKYNQVFCKYVSTDVIAYKDAESHLATCALDINQGAYADSILYLKGTYEEVARINPTTGEVKLQKTPATKAVLNAVGYAKGTEPLYKQLHAHIGVATANSCGVVEKTLNDKFYATWHRPINIFKSVQPVVDANTDGNTIKVFDCIRMYDWRGWKTAETEADCIANQSNMWGDNYWFWAYYGVSAISVDLTKANVEIKFDGEDKWVKLNTVTNKLELYGKTAAGKTVRDAVLTSKFNLAGYNNSAYNALVLRKLQAELGSIHYTNNGDVVKKFSVKVPVTITYEWGQIMTDVVINIDNTIGH